MSRTVAAAAANATTPAMIESLETRQLLSAAIQDGGLLRVNGTPEKDVVVIFLDEDDSSKIVVSERHAGGPEQFTSFRYNRVFRIEVNLGNGNDVLLIDDSSGLIRRKKVLHGDAGNDKIFGGANGDVIYGENGNDTIRGGGGDDVIVGGNGADFLRGGGGDDAVYGLNGDDTLTGDAGINVTDGGNGLDRINGVTEVIPPPSTPLGFNANPINPTRIRLTWIDVADELTYEIQQSPDGVNGWVLIANLGPNTTVFNNTGLTGNTEYFYRLRAVNAGGASAYTTAISATTPVDPMVPPPPAPGNFAATATSPTDVQLVWDDVAGETAYVLQRDDGTGFVDVAILAADTTTFGDTGLTTGTMYTYQLVARNGGGDSSMVTSTAIPL